MSQDASADVSVDVGAQGQGNPQGWEPYNLQALPPIPGGNGSHGQVRLFQVFGVTSGLDMSVVTYSDGTVSYHEPFIPGTETLKAMGIAVG